MQLSDLLKPVLPGYPAAWSPSRLYRYVLWRTWSNVSQPRYLMVVGLNPSVANERKPDPTLTRCIGFAKREGFDALAMTNLYGIVSTDPAGLAVDYPVGDGNDYWLRTVAAGAAAVLVAWSGHPAVKRRAPEVLRMLAETVPAGRIWCLGTTRDGSPRHPLYMSRNAPFTPFPVP